MAVEQNQSVVTGTPDNLQVTEQDLNVDQNGQSKLPEGFNSVDELIEAHTKLLAEQNDDSNHDDDQDDDEVDYDSLDPDDYLVDEDSDSDDDEDEEDEASELREQLLHLQVFNLAGGEEAYGRMTEWAADNLTAAEQSAFNTVIDSGDPALVQFAVASLKSRYEAASDVEGDINVNGGNAGANGAFRSMGELVAALSDPRYEMDEAYRQDVDRRASLMA